jgi:hypothetical protein
MQTITKPEWKIDQPLRNGYLVVITVLGLLSSQRQRSQQVRS